MWATPIFNPFTGVALTSRRVFSPLHLIASQDHPCTTGGEPPHTGRRCLRAAPNLPFITVNKQKQFEAPLSSGSLFFTTFVLWFPVLDAVWLQVRVLELGTCLPASERLGDFDEDRFLSLGFAVEAWEDVCAVKQFSETYSIHPSVPLPPLYPQRVRSETYSIP